MTQPGETGGFTVSDHLKQIKKYGGKDIVNCVIANNEEITEDLKEKYKNEDSIQVKVDKKQIDDLNVDLVLADLVKVEKGFVKHNADKLAAVLINTIMEKKLLYERKKIIEYMYLSQRIKQREDAEKKNDLES